MVGCFVKKIFENFRNMQQIKLQEDIPTNFGR
jgi:hypothetical protein